MPIYNIHLARRLPHIESHIAREIVAGNEKAAERKARDDLPGWVIVPHEAEKPK